MGRKTILRRIAAPLLLAGSLAGIGCGGGSGPEPSAAVQVQAATVQQKTIHEVVSTEAVLYARSEVSIVPKISAPVQKFYVNRGSHVHAGELLAQLENRDLQAAADQAKGAYEQAQAAYATAMAIGVPVQVQAAELTAKETKQARDAAQLVYESRVKLFKAGAISRNLMEEAHVSYIQADNAYQQAETQLNGMEKAGHKAAIQSAEGQLAAAKGQYQAAEANLQYSEIRSPINGVVTDRPLFEGQMASAGTPLMTVMDLSHVVGRAYVSPQQAADVNVGDPASMQPEGGQGDDVPAKVTVVSPALDPNSTTVQVWVDAANPGDRLKPGATVPVNIVAKTVKDALVVPTDAVLTSEDGKTSVMVIGTDMAAHQTAVTTGVREGNETQILSGLKAGQQVVTAGAYALPDGTKVQISKGTEASGGKAD